MQTAMLNRVASKGLGSRLALLALLIFAAATVATLIGTFLLQADFKTALIAFVACLVSTLLAHVAGEYPEGDEFVMARMAVQIAVRCALPLVVAVWGIYFAEPPLEKSLVFYMILFFLVGLVGDVQLSLIRLNAAESNS